MQTPSSEFLSVLGFLYLQHGKARKAATVFETLQILQPNDLKVGQSLAYALVLTEKFDQALELADRWIAKTSDSQPEWKTLKIIRSRALFGLGREHDAVSSMKSFNK